MIPRTKLSADDSTGPVEAIPDNTPGIDEIPRGQDYKKLFAEEAFMNEQVTIMLYPSSDSSEVGVPVSVNGRRIYIVPGKPTKIRRFHLAQLVKARPDVITHRSDDYAAREQDMNRMFRQSHSRYNFDVIQDSPRGIAWLRELRANHIRR